MRAEATRCTCGHGREAHEHLRKGTDCAVCAAGNCRRFRVDTRPADRVESSRTVPESAADAAAVAAGSGRLHVPGRRAAAG